MKHNQPESITRPNQPHEPSLRTHEYGPAANVPITALNYVLLLLRYQQVQYALSKRPASKRTALKRPSSARKKTSLTQKKLPLPITEQPPFHKSRLMPQHLSIMTMAVSEPLCG